MTHPLQFITRYAYPGVGRPHWWVRFTRCGVTEISERFYDADLGGTRKALIAAKAFRDRIAASWEPVLVPRGYRHQPHRARDGFSYTEWWHRGRLRRYWVARWQDDGRDRKQRFEITAARPFYKAKRLAKEWRERMIGERP
jgi:hypothetical protein